MVKKFKARLLRSRIRRLEDRIYYLESFLPIYRESLEEKRDQKLKRLKAKHKHILLPREIKTLTDREYQEYMTRDRINALKDKYRLKERALLHRFSQKNDDDLRDQKHSELKNELERKIASLQQKFAKQARDHTIDEQIRLYHAKKDELEKAFAKRKSEHDHRVEIAYKKEEAKRKKQLETLRQNLLEARQALNSLLESTVSVDLQERLEHNILEIDHLTMMFGGLKAVNDLSFSVKKGEVFGLIGPNGAGKTTVFNCITQFYKPNAGNMYYRNRNDEVVDLNDYAVHDIIRQGIARTFQNVELILELSVIDNMLIGSHSTYKTNFFAHLVHSRRLKREERIEYAKATKILTDLNLIAYRDAYPIGLPYGVLKKIELARTLMTRPNLIILDEPAAGLNDAETRELAITIKKIQKDYDATIFLVEHDMQLVMDICDTICAINFGKKIAIGTPSEIKGNIAVQEAYLGGE